MPDIERIINTISQFLEIKHQKVTTPVEINIPSKKKDCLKIPLQNQIRL